MTKGDIRFKRMISHKIKIEEVGEYLKGMAERTLSFNKVLVSLEDYENLDNKRKVME
jgi:L-iditol 2-dehydrogenase